MSLPCDFTYNNIIKPCDSNLSHTSAEPQIVYCLVMLDYKSNMSHSIIILARQCCVHLLIGLSKSLEARVSPFPSEGVSSACTCPQRQSCTWYYNYKEYADVFIGAQW